MQQVFANSQVNCNKQLQFKHWQIICLNSQKTGSSGGYLEPSELDYLSNTLDEQPGLNTLIAVHHHSIPTNSVWMDTMIIENSHELFMLLESYPQVKAISCGHIHQEMEQIKQGKIILGMPSTCFQFKPHSDEYALDDSEPGYRVFFLYSNGLIKSKIYRLPSP